MSIKSKYTFGTLLPVEDMMVGDFLYLKPDFTGASETVWARLLEVEAHTITPHEVDKERLGDHYTLYSLRVQWPVHPIDDPTDDDEYASGIIMTHIVYPKDEFLVQRFKSDRYGEGEER